MRHRPALLAAAALAAGFGIGLALCRWGAGGNPDLVALTQAVEHGEELEPPIEAGRRRDEAKRALAAEVVARRLSLREAADRFRRLDEADPGYPPGTPRPSGDEQGRYERVLDFVWEVLAQRQQFAAAARWYAEAFAAQPNLLAGPPTGQRYYAAWAAALAGCGRGRDSTDLRNYPRTGARALPGQGLE
jgi:hypothetical protein